MNNAYFLFLDDERYPYNELRGSTDDSLNGTSAYSYTKFRPFKEEEWVIVRDFDAFVSTILREGVPVMVSFDHDLSDIKYSGGKSTFSYKEKTGYDCAKWLCDYCQENNIKFPKYFIHSMNPIGSKNINSYIENYKKHIEG